MEEVAVTELLWLPRFPAGCRRSFCAAGETSRHHIHLQEPFLPPERRDDEFLPINALEIVLKSLTGIRPLSFVNDSPY